MQIPRKKILFRDYSVLLKKILFHKFENANSHITSFEIDMESNIQESKFQKLMGKLGLVAMDELYLELENLKDYHLSRL
ncbi:MAG: hypothetical protein IPL26_23895 [Leptospiraceae bacterium]|nr:hypothetical protein [Leptospiraceae bacterium]